MKKLLIMLAFTFVAFVTNAQTQTQLCFKTNTNGQTVEFSTDYNSTWLIDGQTLVDTSGYLSYTFSDNYTNSLRTVSMIFNGDTLTKQVIVLSSSSSIVDTTDSVDGVGIEEYNFNISVYPNPVVDMLNISFNSSDNEYNINGIDIKIKDLSGRDIISKTIYDNTTIDMNSLNSGLYILVMNSGNNVKIEKILKR